MPESNPLNYRDPRLDPSNRFMIEFIVGIVAGVLAIGLVGFCIVISTWQHTSGSAATGGRSFAHLGVAVGVGFATLVIISIVLFFPTWRRRKLFLAGLLCGVAVASTVASLCFAFG